MNVVSKFSKYRKPLLARHTRSLEMVAPAQFRIFCLPRLLLKDVKIKMYKIKLLLLCKDVKLCSVIKKITQNKDILKQVTEGIFTPKGDVVSDTRLYRKTFVFGSVITCTLRQMLLDDEIMGMQWTRHAYCKGKVRNMYKILAVKRERR
jgi:hypothetical protein